MAKRGWLALLASALLLAVLVPVAQGDGASLYVPCIVATGGSGEARGLMTEDGRLVPMPVRFGEQPAAQVHEQAAPRGPGVLVKRVPDVPPMAFRDILTALGYPEAEGLLVPQWWRVPVPEGHTADEVIAVLRSLPQVEAAEEDDVLELAYTPNDPYFVLYQWGPQIVQAPAAWDVTQGSSDVWVAVVDSGIDYYHEDAPSDLWLGYDFVNSDSYPWDDQGHGTHVAGIVAADTNNAKGIAGMCPDCGVVVIKVMGADGTGSVSDIAQGVMQAADGGAYYGKRVIINLSLGGGYSYAVAEAVAYAQGLGALVVAAAGNDGPGAPSYPASLDGVLAVAATDEDDAPAWSSQYGDIAAPGVVILSTLPLWLTFPPYGFGSGTSMASPCVAGAAGLVWSTFPYYSAAQVDSQLLDGVDVPAGWNANYGAGRLNVYRAVSSTTPTLTPTSTPTATPTATATGQATVPAPTATPTTAPQGPPTPTATPAEWRAPTVYRLCLPLVVRP